MLCRFPLLTSPFSTVRFDYLSLTVCHYIPQHTMRPLYAQLEDRYRQLKQLSESFLCLDGEVIPDEMRESLNIDFHHLDIHTGATSTSVTPYFLPRVSFPSCRDMKGDLKDEVINLAQERSRTKSQWMRSYTLIEYIFPDGLEMTADNYAAHMSKDVESRYRYLESVNPYPGYLSTIDTKDQSLTYDSRIAIHGWVKDL